MTFLRVIVASIDGLWISDLAILRALLPSGLNLSSNDLDTQSHSKISSFLVPSLELQAFSARDLQRRWLEVASVKSGLTLRMSKLSKEWMERVNKQQQFLKEQDMLTKRTVPLYDPQHAGQIGTLRFPYLACITKISNVSRCTI